MKQSLHKNPSHSWLRTRWESLGFAIRGIRYLFIREPNVWIHLVFTILVFVLCCLVSVTGRDMAALLIVIGMVWVAEAFNTAMERLVDFVSPRYHEQAGVVKDIAAGAVLLAAITAVITGAVIFLPKIF